MQLDPAFFEKPYFVTPRDEVGQEAYAVIRDAMRRKEMMGIGHVVLSSRKRPIALEPLENGIRGISLRHIEDMRSPAEYFVDIPELQLPPEMLELAEHIVGSKARDFNPEFLTDHYRAALVELLKEKRAALPTPKTPPVASQQNVVSLMDALKRSLATEEAKSSEPAAKVKKGKKRAAGQREMLLPIAGKGTAKEAAKEKAKEPCETCRSSEESWVIPAPHCAEVELERQRHGTRLSDFLNSLLSLRPLYAWPDVGNDLFCTDTVRYCRLVRTWREYANINILPWLHGHGGRSRRIRAEVIEP